MTQTLETRAVAGRRIEFTYFRDLELPDGPAYPGIVTRTGTGHSNRLLAQIRLDGKRSTLTIPVQYEGLRYLDEVVPVPDLPMGRFTPVADDMNGFYEKAGVLLAAIGEDGEDLVIVTGEMAKARAAAYAYAEEIGIALDSVDVDDLRAHWAVFEWEPEDAEYPWTVRWDAAEIDDQAVHIFYLPA